MTDECPSGAHLLQVAVKTLRFWLVASDDCGHINDLH